MKVLHHYHTQDSPRVILFDGTIYYNVLVQEVTVIIFSGTAIRSGMSDECYVVKPFQMIELAHHSIQAEIYHRLLTEPATTMMELAL